MAEKMYEDHQKEKDELSDEWQSKMIMFQDFLNRHKDHLDEETIF